MSTTDTPDLDAIVVGAGFSGLYMLHRLRDTLGLRAEVIEGTGSTRTCCRSGPGASGSPVSRRSCATCRPSPSASTCAATLSTTNLPDFPGREEFRGESYHSGRWPHGGVDLTGKRVAVIGTGATAVQAVPEIAEQASHVYVLQRTPNYDIAGGNHPMTESDASEIKSNHRDIWARTRETGFGFPYDIADRPARSVGEQERQEIFEEAWARGGFRLGTTFNDLLLDEDPNSTAAEFLRGKIRDVVRDPETAEMLSPRDHPFFTKRPPLENGYYETFNRENVTLIGVRETPIDGITESGVQVAGTEHDVTRSSTPPASTR